MTRFERSSEKDTQGLEAAQEPAMMMKDANVRVPDRTGGWGGKDLSHLQALHERLRFGDFHAEGEVRYAEMAWKHLHDADAELERLQAAGIEDDRTEQARRRKQEAEEELSAIPPEAHVTEYDVALKNGYDKAEERLRDREQELGQRRASKDPQAQALLQDVLRLKAQSENRQCEKTLLVAEAMKLPAAEHLLTEMGKRIGDTVFQWDASNTELQPWKIIYATEVRGGRVGNHVILENEHGGEPKMKFAGIGELSTKRYLSAEEVRSLADPAAGRAASFRATMERALGQLPGASQRAPKALPTGEASAMNEVALVGPAGISSGRSTSLLRREAQPPVTLGMRLERWWRSLWK